MKKKSKDDDDDEEVDFNDANYDEFSGYGGGLFGMKDPYDTDDAEADSIYEEVNTRDRIRSGRIIARNA